MELNSEKTNSPKKLNEDPENGDIKHDTFDFKVHKNQIVLGIITIFGYMGLTFISLITTRSLFQLFTNKESAQIEYKKVTWIINLLPVVGAILGGIITSYCGRKKALLSITIPTIAIYAVILFKDTELLWLCIVEKGLYFIAIGIFNFIVPIYISEILHPEIRDKVGLGAVIFQLLAELIFNFTRKSTATVLVLAIVLSAIFLVLLLWKGYESPYWLVSKWKKDEASDSLKWLNGDSFETEEKIKQVSKLNRDDKKSYFKHALTKKNSKPLMMVLVLIFFQKFSGETTIIYHTHHMLKTTTWTESLGIIFSIFFTVIAIFVVNRLRKKGLLLISALIMAIALGMKAIVRYVQIEDIHDRLYDITAGLDSASYILFHIGHSFGFLYIPWLIMGQLLPRKKKFQLEHSSSVFLVFCF